MSSFDSVFYYLPCVGIACTVSTGLFFSPIVYTHTLGVSLLVVGISLGISISAYGVGNSVGVSITGLPFFQGRELSAVALSGVVSSFCVLLCLMPPPVFLEEPDSFCKVSWTVVWLPLTGFSVGVLEGGWMALMATRHNVGGNRVYSRAVGIVVAGAASVVIWTLYPLPMETIPSVEFDRAMAIALFTSASLCTTVGMMCFFCIQLERGPNEEDRREKYQVNSELEGGLSRSKSGDKSQSRGVARKFFSTVIDKVRFIWASETSIGFYRFNGVIVVCLILATSVGPLFILSIRHTPHVYAMSCSVMPAAVSYPLVWRYVVSQSRLSKWCDPKWVTIGSTVCCGISIASIAIFFGPMGYHTVPLVVLASATFGVCWAGVEAMQNQVSMLHDLRSGHRLSEIDKLHSSALFVLLGGLVVSISFGVVAASGVCVPLEEYEPYEALTIRLFGGLIPGLLLFLAAANVAVSYPISRSVEQDIGRALVEKQKGWRVSDPISRAPLPLSPQFVREHVALSPFSIYPPLPRCRSPLVLSPIVFVLASRITQMALNGRVNSKKYRMRDIRAPPSSLAPVPEHQAVTSWGALPESPAAEVRHS